MRMTTLLMIALMWALPASAEEKVSRLDRFKLWNECEPVYLLVEYLPEKAKEIGLQEKTIATTVRSRLRAAKIFTENRTADDIYVSVNVVGGGFSVEFEYNKWLRDDASGISGRAKTWGQTGTGTHGSDDGYIVQSVSQFTDEFIDEYLRVNAEACEN